jgi:hypothetical protein
MPDRAAAADRVRARWCEQKRRQRADARAGLATFRVRADRAAVECALVEAGLLRPEAADDKAKVEAALSKAVALLSTRD